MGVGFFWGEKKIVTGCFCCLFVDFCFALQPTKQKKVVTADFCLLKLNFKKWIIQALAVHITFRIKYIIYLSLQSWFKDLYNIPLKTSAVPSTYPVFLGIPGNSTLIWRLWEFVQALSVFLSGYVESLKVFLKSFSFKSQQVTNKKSWANNSLLIFVLGMRYDGKRWCFFGKCAV